VSLGEVYRSISISNVFTIPGLISVVAQVAQAEKNVDEDAAFDIDARLERLTRELLIAKSTGVATHKLEGIRQRIDNLEAARVALKIIAGYNELVSSMAASAVA
jgi:hypothetical protein